MTNTCTKNLCLGGEKGPATLAMHMPAGQRKATTGAAPFKLGHGSSSPQTRELKQHMHALNPPGEGKDKTGSALQEQVSVCVARKWKGAVQLQTQEQI